MSLARFKYVSLALYLNYILTVTTVIELSVTNVSPPPVKDIFWYPCPALSNQDRELDNEAVLSACEHVESRSILSVNFRCTLVRWWFGEERGGCVTANQTGSWPNDHNTYISFELNHALRLMKAKCAVQ